MHLPKRGFHCESTPGRQTRLNAKPVSAADAPRIHLSVAVFNLLFLAKARPETQRLDRLRIGSPPGVILNRAMTRPPLKSTGTTPCRALRGPTRTTPPTALNRSRLTDRAAEHPQLAGKFGRMTNEAFCGGKCRWRRKARCGGRWFVRSYRFLPLLVPVIGSMPRRTRSSSICRASAPSWRWGPRFIVVSSAHRCETQVSTLHGVS